MVAEEDIDCERAIMVVEDDRAIRDTLIEILRDNDFRAVGAANGKIAIDKLRATENKPCLILLDVMMPVMDGWQFRDIQRQDPDLKTVPVIVFTAHANVKDVTRRMAIDTALEKPVDLDDVLALAEKYCA